MAVWGLIVAGGLVLGSLPALLGLIFVMPVLGHATWHLYRKVVPRCTHARLAAPGRRRHVRSDAKHCLPLPPEISPTSRFKKDWPSRDNSR